MRHASLLSGPLCGLLLPREFEKAWFHRLRGAGAKDEADAATALRHEPYSDAAYTNGDAGVTRNSGRAQMRAEEAIGVDVWTAVLDCRGNHAR